jgi:hypothetical protein
VLKFKERYQSLWVMLRSCIFCSNVVALGVAFTDLVD